MVLGSDFIKKMDASWAAGTNQGMLDGTESVAGTADYEQWYSVYLIKNSTSGVVDLLASESATAPTMPSGYDFKLLIGAVRYDAGGTLEPFWQWGDEVYHDTPLLSFFDTNPNAVANTRTLDVPIDRKVRAIMTIAINGTVSPTNDACLVTSLEQANVACIADGANALFTCVAAGNNTSDANTINVMTNLLSQIRTRNESGGATNDLYGFTVGWVEPRGRW